MIDIILMCTAFSEMNMTLPIMSNDMLDDTFSDEEIEDENEREDEDIYEFVGDSAMTSGEQEL